MNLTVCRPHVSVTSHGAQVASQHCPILQTGGRGYHGAMKIQEDFGIEVSKQAARKSPKLRNTGSHSPLKKFSSVV